MHTKIKRRTLLCLTYQTPLSLRCEMLLQCYYICLLVIIVFMLLSFCSHLNVNSRLLGNDARGCTNDSLWTSSTTSTCTASSATTAACPARLWAPDSQSADHRQDQKDEERQGEFWNTLREFHLVKFAWKLTFVCPRSRKRARSKCLRSWRSGRASKRSWTRKRRAAPVTRTEISSPRKTLKNGNNSSF